MNDMTEAPGAGDVRAEGFHFTGTWREFLPIALTNLALIVVTLGVYRFWAKARERRYLWSRTRFGEETLEWTGTGKEMLVGFLIVSAVFLPLLLALQFGVEALFLRGRFIEGTLLALSIYSGLFYLYHVARFRALRYQLSRSWWRGIRGGSDHPGWAYGWSGVWKTAAGWAVVGFLVPWAMTQLWNERWSKMSFGPHHFEARSHENGLIGRWMLVYLTPIFGFLTIILLVVAAAALGIADPSAANPAGAIGALLGGLVVFYLVFLIVSLNYYALFYRKTVGATGMAGIQFGFNAGTRDWMKLMFGNIALVIVTLGVGLLFISYRTWSFRVRHLQVSGSLDLEALTQSTARAPGDAEGLADAFDFGAI